MILFGLNDAMVCEIDFKLIKTIKSNDERQNFYVAKFKPDSESNILACGSWNKKIEILDITTGKYIKTLEGHKDRVCSLDFHPNPNSNILASGSFDGEIKIWNIETGECLKTLKGHQQGALYVAFHSDSKVNILVSGSADGTVKIWNNEKCIKIFSKYEYGISVVKSDIDPNSNIFAFGLQNGQVILQNIESGRYIRKYKYDYSISSLAFSKNIENKNIAFGFSKNVKVKILNNTYLYCWDLFNRCSDICSMDWMLFKGNDILVFGSREGDLEISSGFNDAELYCKNKNINENENVISSISCHPNSSSSIFVSVSNCESCVKVWKVIESI